jgi:hypothetical protein
MEKEILKYLKELAGVSTLKDVYVIEFKGTRLVMTSKKSSWKTLSAAKNAIRYEIPTFYQECPDTYRDRLKVIKELEDKEIIKYIKVG